jgi:stress-induced-phosphoprotein 1
MSKAAAQAKKAEGNALFKSKSYQPAIDKYTEAIALDASDVTFYSNRSACYAALEKWEEAAADGRQCIMCDKNFVKGYFRQALALQNIGNLDAALDSAKRGLGIDSTNADLKKMCREIEESQRNIKVEALIAAAETQLANGEVAEAHKTVDTALRQDPENRKLNQLKDRVQPLYERAEKARKSTLSPSERQKEVADGLYKEAKFEEAIKAYSKCLDSISDKSTELALKCYGNRAACYKQVSNFDGIIGDCTAVLEYRSDDVKALVRRAQAFEACERYKSSLQDVRQVLSLGVDKAGKSTFDLCNGMQHRLNKVIADLKKN